MDGQIERWEEKESEISQGKKRRDKREKRWSFDVIEKEQDDQGRGGEDGYVWGL